MKTLLLILSILSFSLTGFTQVTELTLKNDIYHNDGEIFHSHQGEGEWDNTLAMNIGYAQIKSLRAQIEAALNIKLDYFTGWNPNGEAHVTVVLPNEFHKVLKAELSMKQIEDTIARYDIQTARISILGIGSAKGIVKGKPAETFFVIVDSYELRNIRQQVYYKFIREGGDRAAFDPTWFFPHITIGYIESDLHESDGVLKNLKHSLDKRFTLKFVP